MRSSKFFRVPLLLLFLFGSAAVPAHAETSQTVWYGGYLRMRTAGAFVARDATEWVKLWRNLLESPPPRALPDGHVGIALAMGPRRTGGYFLEMTGHEQRPCIDVVTVIEHAPQPGAIVTQAFTTPWMIALVPAGARPVAFERQLPSGENVLTVPPSEGPRLAQMGEACAGLARAQKAP